MTDREMLELAAKASRMPIDYWNDGTEPYSSGEGFVLPSNAIWNPLRDDGDALRLAARLKIDIEWQSTRLGAMPEVEACISDIDGESVCFAEDEQDYRLAIVAAAANLGRGMP